MLFIPLAVGAGIGALGGFMKAQQGPEVTTSETTRDPYGGTDNLDWMMDEAKGIYGAYKDKPSYAEQAYRNLYGKGGNKMNRQAQNQQGGGGGQQQAAPQQGQGQGQGGGGESWISALMSRQGNKGGGRGGGGKGGPPKFLDWQSTASPELQAVLSGEGLDVANNPYVQEMISQLSNQAQTDFERALPGIQGQFASSGRYGSGAMAGQQALAQGEMQRALAQQQAQTQMSAYQQAMDQQTAGLGMQSQETMQGRGAWQQDIANKRTTNASRYGADQSLMGQLAGVRGGIQQAQIGANASMKNAQLQAATQRAGQAAASGDRASALAYQKQADQMRYSLAMDQQSGQQAWGNYNQMQGAMMPIMSNFGTTTQTNTGPEPDMFGSILGGAMGGAGIGGMFGGGGGGGGSAPINPYASAPANFNAMMGMF